MNYPGYVLVVTFTGNLRHLVHADDAHTVRLADIRTLCGRRADSFATEVAEWAEFPVCPRCVRKAGVTETDQGGP
jgi:hypothetical protein